LSSQRRRATFLGRARELCDRLGRRDVEASWTRESAKRWWDARMEAEGAVVLSG
jgi:hypothetical protein